MKDAAKEKPPVQWFVECDAFTNESLEAELSARGLGSDHVSRYVDMPGSDGKPHDVLGIPSGFVKRLMAAKARDSRYVFRLWKRNGPEGAIYPADFLGQKKLFQTAKFKAAVARLEEIKEAKAAKSS